MTATQAATEQAHRQWWVERFGSRPPEAGPPLFRRRSNVYRRRSATVQQPLPPGAVEQLSGAGATTPERLHELFLAAFAGVLYRYLGAAEPQRIVIGTPRPRPDAADADTDALPIAVPVDPEQPFERVVTAAAQSLAESYDRSGGWAAELLEELGVAEVANRHPLFAVVLRVDGYHPPLADLRNDVTASVVGDGSDLGLELEYNANVLDPRTVERLGRHAVGLLTRGLAAPDVPLRACDYLTPGERSQLLDDWSGGPVGPPPAACLHELVEATVDRSPDAEAVVNGEVSISFGELETRANRLANHLRQLGAGAGSKVGLCLEPSDELLVGALAILKSGAAAVPLVPTFPASRNAMTIEDSAMELAVTQASLTDRFPSDGPELVQVDAHADAIARAPDTRPAAGSASGLVYLMFTSGSTGRPKGVALEHRTLVNLVLWQLDRSADAGGGRTLQRTSIGFDVSFQEIFSTWAAGGSLVVAPGEVRDDVSLVAEFVERHAIERLFLPPVALDQLAVSAGLQGRTLPTLKEIIVAGEQLQVSMPIRRLFHEIDCRLDNQYGPTETHVVTAHRLDGPSTRWPEAPPIGRPVRNVRVYVLDPWLQPVPAGVPGELYAGGLAPARGYLTERESAERFLQDPFLDGGRIYRTGDRARHLADGDVEFLGRRDDQVKIRGYRIELGEIEANLLSVPGVRHAAVAVHEVEALGKQLAAYVVPEGEHAPEPGVIREHLLERLPGHMVPAPSSIVSMCELPTTPTGKVDRRALKPPPRVAAAGPAVVRGDTEQTVASVWARAMGVERVSREDNFLDLGGHSLVGIQIVSQLNELYSVALPLRSLLRGATVAGVAEEIDRLRGSVPVTTDEDDAGVDAPALEEVELSNGARIVCLQRAEAEYLYLDVVQRGTYERGGIQLPETGCVVDVGAHVGLFTLHALERSPAIEVIALEPCPPLFEALRRNVEDRGNVRALPYALGSRRDRAELTFYPNLTGMSSFHSDDREERALLSGILRNLGRLGEGAADLLADSEGYLDERLVRSAYTCERRTLSDVLREMAVERVDLLKVDVQKAELEVLEGIEAEDWARIGQLAIEVHDLDGRLDRVTSLLAGRGYAVAVEQDALHVGTPVHFVYAT
jgi:amino acid adenylation domain-containing protein/FkbM family methyltransferase